MDRFHELFNAGGGFGGADEGEIKPLQIDCAGAVESVLDDSQRFLLISAGHCDLGCVVACLKNEKGQVFGHCRPAAVE